MAACLMLAGCTSSIQSTEKPMSTPASPSPSSALGEVNRPDADAYRVCEQILGSSEEEAERSAKDAGVRTRVVSIDGQAQMVTMDYSASRINISLQDGLVTDCTIG